MRIRRAVDLARGFVSVAGQMAKIKFLRLFKIVAGIPTGAENEFSRLERFAHFWVLVGKSFVRNRCPTRAAALSYATLLALIPMLNTTNVSLEIGPDFSVALKPTNSVSAGTFTSAFTETNEVAAMATNSIV